MYDVAELYCKILLASFVYVFLLADVTVDTWDGPNNEPIIYHGHTLTSKILFKDVVQAINDYAFVMSEYVYCTTDILRMRGSNVVSILSFGYM